MNTLLNKTVQQTSSLCAAAIAAAALFLTSTSAQASLTKPLLEFRFNGSGTTVTSTGTNEVTGSFLDKTAVDGPITSKDLHSGAGKGVSGQPGDLAFNNTHATRMGGNANSPGAGGVLSAPNAFSGVTEFTISGWYNASSNPGASARLFAGGGIDLFFSSDLTLKLGNDSYTVPKAGGGDVYYQTDKWVFFAITFTVGGDNNVNFYYGNTEDEVTLVHSSTSARTAAFNASTLTIGNVSNLDRPFRGYLDDFRMWDSALSAEQLKQVQAADLANAQIPEASTYALLGACAAFGAVVLARRRRAV